MGRVGIGPSSGGVAGVLDLHLEVLGYKLEGEGVVLSHVVLPEELAPVLKQQQLPAKHGHQHPLLKSPAGGHRYAMGRGFFSHSLRGFWKFVRMISIAMSSMSIWT